MSLASCASIVAIIISTTGDRHCHYEPVNVGTGDPDAHRHHQGARA